MSLPPFLSEAPLPLLPLRHGVVLPGAVTSLPVGRPKSRALAEAMSAGDHLVLSVQRDPNLIDPELRDMHGIGVLVWVRQKQDRGSRGQVLVVEALGRVLLDSIEAREPYLRVMVREARDLRGDDAEATILSDSLRTYVKESTSGDAAALPVLEAARTPSALADAIATFLEPEDTGKLRVLGELDVVARLRLARDLFAEAKARVELKSRIEAEVRRDLGEHQKQAILRQQLRAIQKELGEGEDDDPVEELRRKLEDADLTEEARKVADRELRRLEAIGPQQAEANVIRNYLEWIADLPWNTRADAHDDLDAVSRALDADHHGLAEVKKRILEHMAVLRLSKKPQATILCLAGPPGVGKTSLAQSVADATGRPLVRVSLGGVRDEAEVRGHRRTYVGSIPGRILHGLRKAKVKNPVVVLDEIDKMGRGIAGDPEAALLEVLDPAQNQFFVDHYLEIPFDLSEVLFIATANDLGNLSLPLRDRLEILELAGYPEEEKVQIARKHLLPRVVEETGLPAGSLVVDEKTLHAIVRDYTREAGVRKLRQQLQKIARGVALEIARAKDDASRHVIVTEADLPTHLGKRKVRHTGKETHDAPGVAAGLAWTPVGGDVLFVETTRMPGKGRVEITGQLGDVMKESARTALAWLRSHAADVGLDPAFLETSDVHVHVPAGAVPKDGPSAGVTLLTAFASLFTGRKVRSDTAMTGEATLRGRVLPVGGIESKVLAAERGGFARVILPAENAIDYEDVPATVRERLEVHFVDDMREVLELALEPAAEVRPLPSQGNDGTNTGDGRIAA